MRDGSAGWEQQAGAYAKASRPLLRRCQGSLARTPGVGSAGPSREDGSQHGSRWVRTPDLARSPERLRTDGAGRGCGDRHPGGRGIGQPVMERPSAPGVTDQGRGLGRSILSGCRDGPALATSLGAPGPEIGWGFAGEFPMGSHPMLARDFRPAVANGLGQGPDDRCADPGQDRRPGFYRGLLKGGTQASTQGVRTPNLARATRNVRRRAARDGIRVLAPATQGAGDRCTWPADPPSLVDAAGNGCRAGG